MATTDATVTIGELPGDDDLALYVTGSSPFSIFTDYMIMNRYEKDKHIYMMPIASPSGFQGDSVSFVQLASPTLLWIVDWTAARYNEHPEIPDSNSGNRNWILLDEHYEPAMISVAPDGITPMYRISGTFAYGHRNPSRQTPHNIEFSRPPWLEDVFDRTMPTNKIQKGLMERNVAGPTSVSAPGVPASQGYSVETFGEGELRR